MDLQILHRKERLILTAIEIIDELGIQGLSIREVAKRQGISNAALFNHFKSKDDLILGVLDHFTQFDVAIEQSIQTKNLKGKEAIIYFIDSLVTYYENYPAITAIIHAYDVLRCEPKLKEKIESTVMNRNNHLKKMVEEAQKLGQVSTDCDSQCVSDVIIGSCRAASLRWRISQYDFSLRQQVICTLHLILDSFASK